MDQPTILIVSDDVEFARAVTQRWKAERSVPRFTLVSGDLCPGPDAQGFDAVIAGRLSPGSEVPIMAALDKTGRPTVVVRDAGGVGGPKLNPKSHLKILRCEGDWLDVSILILAESLNTWEAKAKIQRLEKTNAVLARDAALGRYILEMRHSLNNALTSVLGNSELLLLEPETIAPLELKVRPQIDTIRNMALRIHEIMQRFSSLEKEMNIAGKQTASEQVRAATAGS